MPVLARLLPALALLALCAPARAEGLVQLTLAGSVLPSGGAPVEVELELWDPAKKELVPLSINVHLAVGTRGCDLATLLATRLRRAGARVDFPGESGAREANDPVHLFVESVTAVHLRLGHGLWAIVTLCDAAPASLRVLPPQLRRGEASLTLGVTTFLAHSRQLGRHELHVEFSELASAAEISETLTSAAISHGWMADRPRPDSFACSRTDDGALVTGCSVHLGFDAAADWRLELKLDKPREDGFGR